MVERDKFKILVKGMKAVYTKQEFIPDQDAFNVWYALLRDIDYEILTSAVQKHMMSSPYPPTIADIRGAAAQFTPGGDINQISELEAWGTVRMAISNSIYNSGAEYEKLSPLVQKAVGNSQNLAEWALLDTEAVNSVVQSNFIRSYRAVVSREKEMQKLSPSVRNLIEIASGKGLEQKNSVSEAASLPLPERRFDEI